MNKKKNSKAFFNWIHTNRLKLILWLFFAVLPISLVIGIYAGSYISNTSVYFDQEITETSEKISDFKTIDDLKTIKLFVDWDSLKVPTEDDEGTLTGGYYKFVIAYETKDNYQVSSVKVTPVLKTDWKDIASIGYQRSIYTTNSTMSIDFNYEMPLTPLWFVKVEDPNLYLKVEYTYESAGQNISEIEYVKVSLKGVDPATVIPN